GGVSVHGGEDEIDAGRVEPGGILHRHARERRIERLLAIPADGARGLGDRVLVALAGGGGGGGEGDDLEEGMGGEPDQELLTRETSGADDGDALGVHGPIQYHAATRFSASSRTPRRMLKKVQMRGGARRPHARRSLSTLSVRPRAPTSEMGLFSASGDALGDAA